jgi:hypothetical protein
MEFNDYPNYFQASDKLSIDSQNTYLNIIRVDLIAMIFAAFLAIYSFQTTEYKLAVHIFYWTFSSNRPNSYNNSEKQEI